MDASRYSCQIALPGFGKQAQQLLQQARVLIVGAGGLGCPAAQYLAASGIGTLGLADGDTISLSNLHRQTLYAPGDTGLKKVDVAKAKLQMQNPGINIRTHAYKVNADNAAALFGQYEVIVDCTDNFSSRYLLNDAAVILGKPLIYGAIYQFEGQVSVFNAFNQDGTRSPNYRDVFPEVDATQVPNCAEGGVIPTIAGIIGCMQANEVIKLITGTGDLLCGRILTFDALTMQTRVIKIGRVTKTNIINMPVSAPVDTITAAQLRATLASDIDLIDIRSSTEHDEFDIGGRNIPAYKLERELASVGKEKTVVLYCAIGMRSAEAVKQLKKVYPDLHIVSLAGGINEFLKQQDH